MGLAAVLAENLPPEGVFSGIAVDSDELDKAGVPKGATLIVDLEQSPQVKNRQVVCRLKGNDGYDLFQYLDDLGSSFKVRDPATGKDQKLAKARVLSMHLVYSTIMPR